MWDGKTSAVFRQRVRRRGGVRSAPAATGSDPLWGVASARVSAVQVSDAVGLGCNRSRIHGGPIVTFRDKWRGISDVTIDAPGHAVVQTTETWSGEVNSASTGQLIQRLPPTNYAETYTVEFQNGSWIVTLNQLRQI